MKQVDPIFLVGFPRSGNTLLSNLIGSHSEIGMPLQNLRLWEVVYQIAKDGVALDKKEYLIGVLMTQIMDRDKLKFELNDYRSLIEYIHTNKKVNFKHLTDYIFSIYLKKINKNIWGVKEPGAEKLTDEILKNYPNAKMIHIVRNPVNSIVSRKKNEKEIDLNFNPFHIKLNKESLRCAIENQKKYPRNYHVIRYEDLVENTKDELIKICDFLNIMYEPDMLKMEGNQDWKGHNSSFEQQDEIKVYKDALDRSDKLTNFEKYYINKKMEKELKYFGYSIPCNKLSFAEIKPFISIKLISAVQTVGFHILPLLDRLHIKMAIVNFWRKIKRKLNFG